MTGSPRATRAGGRRSSRRAPPRSSPELDAVVAAGARRILDVGIGTGNLALPGVARWPHVHVTGIDASGEMVKAVEALADARLAPADRAAVRCRDGVRRPPAVRRRQLRRARSPRSCSSSSRAGRAPSARSGACCGRADPRLRDVAAGRPRLRARPDLRRGSSTSSASRTRAGRRPGDVPSVERAAAELRRAGSATSRPARRAGARLRRRRLHRVPDRVRRGEPVRVDGPPRAPSLPRRRCANALDGARTGRMTLPCPDRDRDRHPDRARVAGADAVRRPGVSGRCRPPLRHRRPGSRPRPRPRRLPRPRRPRRPATSSTSATRGAWTLAMISSPSVAVSRRRG